MNLRRVFLWLLPIGLRSKLLRNSGFRERYALDMAENKELCAELLEMMRVDQEVRQEMTYIFENWQNPQAHEHIRTIMIRSMEVDEANRARLKEIVRDYGFPGNRLVGVMGAQAAWLIAQHSDNDRAFQKEYLALLEKAVAEKDAEANLLAYLTDRVRVDEGQPQLYGTQWQGDGKPAPIEDEASLEKRRKAVGLEPFSEYSTRMSELASANVGDVTEYQRVMAQITKELPDKYKQKM